MYFDGNRVICGLLFRFWTVTTENNRGVLWFHFEIRVVASIPQRQLLLVRTAKWTQWANDDELRSSEEEWAHCVHSLLLLAKYGCVHRPEPIPHLVPPIETALAVFQPIWLVIGAMLELLINEEIWSQISEMVNNATINVTLRTVSQIAQSKYAKFMKILSNNCKLFINIRSKLTNKIQSN